MIPKNFRLTYITRKSRALGRAAFVLALALPFLFSPAYAQARKAPKSAPYTLAHQPPGAEKLPFPGQELPLTVKLVGTRDSNFALRALVVRDGKSMEINNSRAMYNEQDQPTWTISVPSPIGELSYQFFLAGQQGEIISTQKFTIRRSCLPNITQAQTDIRPEVQGDLRLSILINESKRLENDLDSYEVIMGLLKDLQERLK